MKQTFLKIMANINFIEQLITSMQEAIEKLEHEKDRNKIHSLRMFILELSKKIDTELKK